jgi:tetratricopeptide (TPR) repeat protein
MNRIFTPILIAAIIASFVASATATPLDDQMAAFLKAPDTQPESAVTAMLKTGLAERRSAEALAKAQAWFNRNQPKSQATLFYGGRVAEYSGKSLQAVSFYRRLLKMAKVDRKFADTAASAIYRLLLGVLKDPNAAYLFMRSEGNRLRAFGRARQYDRWFLEEAKRRRDAVALCDRLAIILNDRASDATRYGDDLKWICLYFERFAKQDAVEYQAAGRLATAAKTPPVVKARLQWVAAVMPYNMQLDKLREAKSPADPKLTDKPLAAAAQLLKVAPDLGAILVAKGWGVEYDHGHSGNCKKRFDVEGKRKLAQLLAVIQRMSPDKRDDLLAYPIAQNRVKFAPADVRKQVLKYPGMLNSLSAANVPLVDKTLTVAEARALAPHLARSPHAHAAVVRGMAAAGNNKLSAIVAAIMKTEMWRFNSPKLAIDTVWNSGAQRDVQHNVMLKKYKTPDARYERLKKQCDKKAGSNDRLSAFATLQKDLLSGAPSISGSLSLFDKLLISTGNSDADKVKMLKSLLSTTDTERIALLQRVITRIGFGSHNRTIRLDTMIDGGWERHHHDVMIKVLPELASRLQGTLGKQLKAGKLSELILGMWLRCVDPKKPESVAMMKSLLASRAYQNVDTGYHRLAAYSGYFGDIALTPAMAATNPRHVSRELLALAPDASAKAVEAALKTVVTRVSNAPDRLVIHGLKPVASLPKLAGQTREMVMSLFGPLAHLDKMPAGQGYGQLARRLLRDAKESGNFGQIEQAVAGIWQASVLTYPYTAVSDSTAFAEAALLDGDVSPATSMARIGLHYLTPQLRDGTGYITRLKRVRGKTSIAMGIIDIPVDKQDPTYAIYKSQAEFAEGNLSASWKLYNAAADQLQPIVRKLTVQYCLWLLNRNIDDHRGDRAEALVKELTIWSRQATGSFTAREQADLKIAYADIAFQKGALKTARAWYRRVADAEEHKGSELQYKAVLRSVKVDRVARDFSSAITDLEKLMLVRDSDLRMRAHFALAEVFYDQEKFADSYDEIKAVLKRDPNHADALILMGEVQLVMRKLVDASEIELGISRDSKFIVPGETIKINLIDPTLSISGVGADIEVEIWSASGDRERVMLHQLGDNKTKFRAEVPTRLAVPRPGDKVLQVLGRDKIRYGYSKRFRAKMADLPPDPKVVISVASNARLNLTAGAFPARKGERKLDLSELGISSAQRALGTRRVRPGNPIYLRVFDPDQSRTADVDKIAVALTTSSGDVISPLILKETGTHTGEFEAVVPTARAQALAFASESSSGRDANMAISAKPYPGWSGKVGSKARERIFGIDLNDNVPLGKMTIRCGDTGQALTHFVLQTSMNGRDWIARARYPDNPAPWDGRPQITSFPTYSRGISVSIPETRELPKDWREMMEIGSARKEIPYASVTVKGIANLNVDLASGGHPGYSILTRYRAVFYQDAVAIRTFRLDGLPLAKQPQTIFLLDGKPSDESSPLTITRELKPGLHEIQVWRNESRSALMKRKPVLLCNVSGKKELAPCPDSMFDPSKFPAAARKLIAMPATVKAGNDAATQFDVEFGANTRARLVRVAILGHQGAAPAIEKVTLTDLKGAKHLPLEVDYQALRKNQCLEVLPGDYVTARYEDDCVVSKNRKRLQGRLGVAYNTATISASFLNYETTEQGQKPLLEDIRRFKLDDSVAIVITDPDMDQSPKRDQLTFKVSAGGGAPVSIVALETDSHTGVFLGRVYPISSAPTRKTEIQIPAGGTLTATYRDTENLDPGIPTDRSVTIEHARYAAPSLAVYNITSKPLPPPPVEKKPKKGDKGKDDTGPEIIQPRRSLNYAYMDPEAIKAQRPQAVIGATLRFDVVATHLAFAASSSITAYVQTDAGRKAHGAKATTPFDVRVPGTLKLTAQPVAAEVDSVPAGYVIGKSPSSPSSQPPLDEGRFSFSIPLILDDLPSRSYATQAAESLPSSQIPDGLAVRDGDRVHIGYAYKDQQDKLHWHTATVTLGSNVFLDVMNGHYRRTISTAYVGEKLYVRLIAPALDSSDGRDVTTVNLRAASGSATAFQLRETSAHTGEFKGSFALSYASAAAGKKLPAVELHGFPVKYGDKVTVSHRGSGSSGPPALSVAVNKGADGGIEPFSKRYTEDAMAIKTTFTLAECFFELAKHHRKMDQESLARREMEHAQKLLAEAIASHNDDELRAHAEYLLGNLAQEYADLSKNEASKKLMYQDALARFSKIPLDYPDAEFAPKAQFKKALVYEKMGELEIAVEEYVKLAYKYPDHELIPMVMSRLGSYFQKQGLAYKTRAVELEKKENDDHAAGEALRLRDLATKEYLNAAQVFAKLQKRFSDDKLAGLAGLRSAQNYMRAKHYETAIKGFQKVVDEEKYDGKTIRSQALYWSGLSQERMNQTQEAYELYRRVTFDFPDSIWAKHARGRLSDPVFEKIIKIEEEMRDRLLDQLKKMK